MHGSRCVLTSGAVPSLVERIAKKAFRPFYRPYYRLLWGRRFPGHATLERLVRWYEAASRRGDVPIAGGDWDAQYTGGDWDFLADATEVARFRAVAGLIERRAPPGTGHGGVLDVGCGEGLLPRYLEPGRPYLGIDLSREAVARAEARYGAVHGDGEAPRFEVADAESWRPPRRFTAVVLNECLYYFRRPLAGARRYLDSVEPGGVMIVSMFRGPRADAIGRRLAAELPVTESIEVARGHKRWRIAAFRPPAAGAPAATAPPPAPSRTP